MSGIAERLARDIAAVTGGVVVNETDLRAARSALHERIESRRRPDRVRTAAAAAAVIALAGLGVTAVATLDKNDAMTQVAGPRMPEDPLDAGYLTGRAPTAQVVEGVWRLDNGETIVKFDKSGTVQFDDHGTLFSGPVTTATYAIDGARITVTITGDREPGCIGSAFTVRASLPEPGLMRFIGSETAGACAPLPSGQAALEQVLPSSRSMAGLVFSQEDGGWQPLSREATLHGVWLAEGGGHLLEMNPEGSYYIADDAGEPIDTGRWSLRGADLTLTSSARSTTRCSEGDQFVLAAVDWSDSGTRALRGTVKQNACGGAWTPAAWILIPNKDS